MLQEACWGQATCALEGEMAVGIAGGLAAKGLSAHKVVTLAVFNARVRVVVKSKDTGRGAPAELVSRTTSRFLSALSCADIDTVLVELRLASRALGAQVALIIW
jgi:hypothetical protein